jgi:regulator of protease activity HflC (stomatin/prohibitin superfamily)
MNKSVMWSVLGVVAFFSLIVVFLSWYIVPEGHVAILKHTGRAVSQQDPGLHWKIPFLQTVETTDVRQRKTVESLSAATRNQLPTTAEVSVNWTVDKEAAMELYIQYGGLTQFETRVLNPKLRSSAKQSIAHFPADEIIRNRQAVVAEIRAAMVEVLAPFPITINDAQLEDITLPERYLEAVQAKEEARELAERERHTLAQQELQAQQKVNTANAERDAAIARADGVAYKIKKEAEAEAEAIRLINAELLSSPAYVDLVKAKRWNGVLPQTLLGGGEDILLSVR